MVIETNLSGGKSTATSVNNVTNSSVSPNWVPVREAPVFSPRKIKVVCVGAGFSGLMLAYKWKHHKLKEFINLTIYEKNPEVGGTWYENRYPGVGCDVQLSLETRNIV